MHVLGFQIPKFLLIKLEKKTRVWLFLDFWEKTNFSAKCVVSHWNGWFDLFWTWHRSLYCQFNHFHKKKLFTNLLRISLNELLKATTVMITIFFCCKTYKFICNMCCVMCDAWCRMFQTCFFVRSVLYK